MKRKTINDIISYHLMDYGRGYEYECYLNDQWVGQVSKLRKLAQPDDLVRVRVYSKGQFEVGTVHFHIKMNDDVTWYVRSVKRLPTNRDYQRQRCYNAERRMMYDFDYQMKSVDEITAQTLADEITQLYGLNWKIDVKVSGRAKRGLSYRHNNKVVLPITNSGTMTVLHEVAHQITDGITLSEPGHGPTWVEIVTDLYEIYLDWSRVEMLEIWNKYKVKGNFST